MKTLVIVGTFLLVWSIGVTLATTMFEKCWKLNHKDREFDIDRISVGVEILTMLSWFTFILLSIKYLCIIAYRYYKRKTLDKGL